MNKHLNSIKESKESQIVDYIETEEPVTLIQVLEDLEKLNGGRLGCFGSEAQRLWVVHNILITNSIRKFFNK